jgi:formylglycine-generating enzyme required for sulfatase activity
MDKQQQLDQLFAHAKQDQAIQSFEQTKDRFMASLNHPAVNKPKTKQIFTKKWIIMLTTVSTLSISLFLLWNNGKSDKTPLLAETKQADQTVSPTLPIPIQQNPEPPINQAPVQKPTPFVNVMQELVTELPLALLVSENKGTEASNDYSINRKTASFKPAEDIPYQFPKLTEEEIAITKKKKKSMLKALAKHDKDAYAFIPSGSFDYNGKQISAQAFYMGINEVTNFEYRTFLFDLIIQGRKDEFLKAKPDQSKWNSYPMYNLKYFQDNYFSEKKYNDYPVVNISREGAELYCKWLSQEVRKYVGDEKEGQYNDVRLPLRTEWVKAASNEGKQLPYPWNGPYIRHSTGAFQGNFVWGKTDSTTAKAYELDTLKIHDILAPVKSYWPNALGLYNLSGNAAEMVYEGMDKSEPGTAGGSWRSWPEEVKIYGEDKYKGIVDPKPTIGFRVVSTYLIVYDKK